MRQSLAQLEREFEQESDLDRQRREQLRRQAIQRTRVRRKERIQTHQKLRFLLLLGSLMLTVLGVTWAMFQTLAWLMG
jgi:hypothetical protein